MGKGRSMAKLSLQLTGAFESDILVMLLLMQWKHPHAANAEFRVSLLESASEALRASIGGDRLFEELAPKDVNLVAALWYAEATTLEADRSIPAQERTLRTMWLEAVKRSIPSCFCDPEF